MTSHTNEAEIDTLRQLDNKLRDIIGCICAFREDYDGKSWNNKTQDWEDCECLEKLPQIKNIITTKIVEAEKAFGGCKLCYGKGYSTEFNVTTSKYGTSYTPNKMNYCTCDRGKSLKQQIGGKQ